MAGICADAAETYSIDLERWYNLPAWAQCAMIAQINKKAKIARWIEIWADKEK